MHCLSNLARIHFYEMGIFFQGFVNSLVPTGSTNGVKDIVNVINILDTHLDDSSAKQLYTWIRDLCKQQEIGTYLYNIEMYILAYTVTEREQGFPHHSTISESYSK